MSLGTVIDESLAEKVFYGMRLDLATGDLTVEVISGGNGVVTLPSEDVIDRNDYRAWAWSNATLRFRFSEKGHLEMVIV